MLVKLGNKIINLANVNLLNFTPGENGKPSVLNILFQRNQYDDTNSILTLKGEEADAVWNKANSLLAQ